MFARVNNRTITSRDIEESLKPLIYTVQEQVYAARKQDLDMRINDLLLEQEAKRQNQTPAALLSNAIRAKLPIITDQQARAYYNANKANLNGDFDKLKLQIVEYLTQQEEQKLTLAFAEQLKQNAAVQIYLTPPDPPTFKIAIDDQPTRGNPNAKVTVVQFTDFECATCARQQQVFDRLVSELEAQVKFVVRDFPVAAESTCCQSGRSSGSSARSGKVLGIRRGALCTPICVEG